MGIEEEKRILAQVPMPKDQPERWQAKWDQSMQNIAYLLQRQQEVLRQSGLMVPGETQLPWEQQQPEDVGSMSTEQIQQMLRQMQ